MPSWLAGAGNLSFTPESYKLWINSIVLQNDDGLSNQFYMCSPDQGGTIKVKGQTTLASGATMYTADPAANDGSL